MSRQDTSRAAPRVVGPVPLVGLLAALVALGVGLAVAGVDGAVALDRPGIVAIDLFAGHRAAAVGLAELGDPVAVGVLAALLATVLLVVRPRRLVAAAVVLTAPAAAGALTQLLLKPVVGRTLAGTDAYPSGHATGLWALGTVAVLLILRASRSRRTRRAAAALLVAVMTASGVALVGAQYHFATDVVGGALVGIAVACAVVCLVDRWARPRRSSWAGGVASR